MRIDWTPLDRAMEGRNPVFWWRDDDVIAPGAALDRLIGMASEIGAPLTLAAIPAAVSPALSPRIDAAEGVDIAVHGWSHVNHAPEGEKNAEFGAHRPASERVADAERGLRRIEEVFGERALPVFIAPWNRMALDVVPTLAGKGYRGYSLYGKRMPDHSTLARFDAHLDPIDWRGTRSLVDPTDFIARIVDLMADDAPIGLMTHHLAHDDAVWAFVDELTTRLATRGARWAALATLISQGEATGG